MEELFIEYFKFKKDDNKYKSFDESIIIDELNPNLLLKINIEKMLDTNLYDKKDIIIEKIKFQIDNNLYEKITSNGDFGMYINSEFLNYLIYNFVHEYMVKNELPIIGQYSKDIYNFFRKSREDFEYDISLNNGCFLYELIIKNKLKEILQIELNKGQASLFLNYALKNLEIYNHKTAFKIIKIDEIKLISNKFDLIFINKSKIFDNNTSVFDEIDKLININGYLIIHNYVINEEINIYLNSHYKYYERELYEIEGLTIYKKFK